MSFIETLAIALRPRHSETLEEVRTNYDELSIPHSGGYTYSPSSVEAWQMILAKLNPDKSHYRSFPYVQGFKVNYHPTDIPGVFVCQVLADDVTRQAGILQSYPNFITQKTDPQSIIFYSPEVHST